MSRLPKSWAEAPIRELMKSLPDGKLVHQGWSPQCESGPARSDSDWGALKTTAIQDGAYLPEHNKRLPDSLEAKERLEVQPGDLLMTCAGPRVRCGVACLVKETPAKRFISGKMYRFRANEQLIDPRLLEAFLRTPETKRQIDAMKTGISESGMNITHERFSQLDVPVAPRPEQKRIADKLDSVLTRVDAVNTRLARVGPILKRFRQSVLTAATSGRLTEDWRQEVLGTQQHEYQITEISVPYPQRITGPKGWTPHIFDQVVDLVGGSQPPKTTFVHEVQPDYVRLIQIRDYKSDRHLTYIPRALARRLCSTTDVMIGRYGPPIFQILRGLEGAYNVALMKAVPKDGLLTNDYLYYWLQRDDLLRFVEAGSDRTAGQDGVRKEHLVKYPVFVPSVQEQAEIVRRVEALFAFADRLEARLQTAKTATERLTPALLAKAFRGELVPQDPNDEPASELLRRLQHEAPLTNAKRGRKSAA